MFFSLLFSVSEDDPSQEFKKTVVGLGTFSIGCACMLKTGVPESTFNSFLAYKGGVFFS